MIKEDLITVKKLHVDRKLHWRIIYRITILTLYSLGFLGIASYHYFADDLNFFTSVLMFSLGFFLGLFFVSRMFGIKWDGKRAIVAATGMNGFGFLMLVLYVAIRYWSNNLVDFVLHPGLAKIPGLTFCMVAGIMLGRLFYTIVTIRKVHAEKDNKNTNE